MKKIKQLQAKVFAAIACEAYELSQAPVSERAALGAGAGLVYAAASASSVFASDRFDVALGKMLQKIYKYILGISTGLAIVFAAINIVKYMVATDPQSALMAKKSAIRVGIAWLILNSLGAIVTLFSGLASGGEYSGQWYSN